jgi:hypothetical protein
MELMQYNIWCELALSEGLILYLCRFKLTDWMNSIKDKRVVSRITHLLLIQEGEHCDGEAIANCITSYIID